MISRRGFLTLPLSASALAQTPPIYDVLLKHGHVLDFRNKRNGRFDIALVKDKVVRVAADLPVAHARLVLDLGDYYVTPGLIDIHTHFDAGGADLNLQPDHHALPNGVTTAVDAGGTAGDVVRSSSVSGARDAACFGRTRRALHGCRRARGGARQKAERRALEFRHRLIAQQWAYRDRRPAISNRHALPP